jgi:triose/dihydroxyacetone kinase / FAD-AMP lyase (cyclizing)
MLEAALMAATEALIETAPRLTELDQAVGDGDLGISLERGARAVREAMSTYPLDDPAATIHDLGVTLQRSLGGTSGPLYAAFCLRAARTLRGRPVDAAGWVEAFRSGCDAVAELGGAARGDRTMLDSLLPAANAFAATLKSDQSAGAILRAGAAAAADGARATTTLMPRRGRSSYLGQRALGHIDPGAEAVAIWLAALARG